MHPAIKIFDKNEYSITFWNFKTATIHFEQALKTSQIFREIRLTYDGRVFLKIKPKIKPKYFSKVLTRDITNLVSFTQKHKSYDWFLNE